MIGSPSRLLLLGALALALALPARALDFEQARADMLRAIEANARRAAPATGRAAIAPPVMAAMGRVPRHEFVPEALREFAYVNRPLPIGEDQTISQPYIVALMTDLLDVVPGDRILEVGTGSGYQAAVLAEMGAKVWSIEIIDTLARSARARLERLGYRDVSVRAGDGYHGWADEAPFDGIVVTAAAPHVPQPLVDQLAPDAALVIPVGPAGAVQQLLVIEKQADGGIATRAVLPVRFVPLTGGH